MVNVVEEPVEEKSEPEQIEPVFAEVTPRKEKRPANRLQRLPHSMAETFFRDEQSSYLSEAQHDRAAEEDHDYPFCGSKHLNPIGVNEHSVKLMHRTRNDFDKINKLNPGVVPRSITNYEAYQRGDTSKTRTKGLFQNDP